MRDLWKNSHYVHESTEILNICMYEYIYTHIKYYIHVWYFKKQYGTWVDDSVGQSVHCPSVRIQVLISRNNTNPDTLACL